MSRVWLAALLTAWMPGAAQAVSVGDCDDRVANPVFIAEPWAANSRTFYKDQVRVALIDTGGEPVCCSMHLMLLTPNRDDELGGRTCHLVHNVENRGFAGIDFAKLSASYDAKRGLLITFPYSLMNEDGDGTKPGIGRVRINIAKNTIAAE